MSSTVKNEWRAIGLPRVDESTIVAAVNEIGWVWADCIHIAANESMAKALRARGVVGISIAEFSDLFVWAGMPAGWRLDADSYPGARGWTRPESATDTNANVEEELKEWRRNSQSKKFEFGIDLDVVIRNHLRRHARHPDVGRILLRSSTELREAMIFLINAGFKATDFATSDRTLQVALDAWQHLEQERPTCTNFRRDLWADPSLIANPTSAEERSLADRLAKVVSLLGTPDSTRARIIHHGFYFFTPPQWALFRLLKELPKTDQLFIVHDDGISRAHETWRRYFVERWGMPRVELRGTAVSEPRFGALADALGGRRVDEKLISNSLRIVKCRNTTEFVRQWKSEVNEAVVRGDKPPTLFAPDRGNIKRVLGRMTDEDSSSVDLANLPIGQFLLALHECFDTSESDVPTLIMTAGHLIDIVASGLVDDDGDALAPSQAVDSFKRVMPFFEDLRILDHWCERAVELERLIVSEVSPLGARVDGRGDVERIRIAASNELRLAPWCDISEPEALMIKQTLLRVRALVTELVSGGMRRTDKYLDWVRRRLQRAMTAMSPAERVELESKLRNFSIGVDYELDFEGLREVVGLLLGRKVDKGLSGEDIGLDDDESIYRRVKDIRFADVVGFEGSAGDIHIGNLSDDVFPSVVSPFAWPFAEEALKKDGYEQVSLELFQTRRSNSVLEGLYLLSLVLEGAPSACRVTLSWIAESSGESRNPSSLVSLVSDLSKPKKPTAEVMAQIGGVKIDSATPDGVINAILEPVVAKASDDDRPDYESAGAAALIDRLAASSGLACSRRFVLQWALGPSAAFQSSHNQAMLFGNIKGAMFRRGRYKSDPDDIRMQKIHRTTKDLWRHLTRGQRRSSFIKRVVPAAGNGASWHWIFTMAGSKDGVTSLDQAYQAAKGAPIPLAALVGSDPTAIIPMPGTNVTKKECDSCPVAPRCSVRIFDEGDVR